jgi:hypothetical protein
MKYKIITENTSSAAVVRCHGGNQYCCYACHCDDCKTP